MFKKFKEWSLRSKKTFAKGLCFDKLFWFFMLGSVFGVYYEQILNLIKSLLKNGTIFWEYRRGVIYGPFNPLYGFAAIILIWFFKRKKYTNLKIFIYGSLIGGFFEYMVCFLQEKITGQVSWDYSKQLLNINGRTTIPIMLFWGFLTVLLVSYVYPFISKYIEKMPYNLGGFLTKVCLVFMIINCLISWGAVIRQGFRIRGAKQYTIIDKFFDKYYPDDYLRKKYPNMKVAK